MNRFLIANADGGFLLLNRMSGWIGTLFKAQKSHILS